MRNNRAAPPRSRGVSRRCAFSLVEVILAVGLFAIAVMVLAAAYVNVLDSVDRVKTDQALEQELSFVRTQVLLEPELENVEAGGEVPTATHGVARWSASVSPTAVADLFRVDLQIELAGDGADVPGRTLSQTLYLLRSSWSDPVERDTLRAEHRKALEEARRFRPL